MIEELHGFVCRKQAEELAVAAKDNDLNQRTDTGDALLNTAEDNTVACLAMFSGNSLLLHIGCLLY